MLDETSMAALLETFLTESEEGLQTAEDALLVLERDPDDAEALALAFRAVHTLKGNAGLFDFQALTTIAHAMEELLDGLRSGRRYPSPGVMSILLDAVDTLRRLLAGDDCTREVTVREQELIERLNGTSDGDSGTGAAPRAAAQRATHTLRIDVSRLDRLLDLSGEIAVARARAGQMLEDPSVPRRMVLETERDADLLHLEMQELVMKLRMLPVGSSFRQLHRIVRDAARSTGKAAELRVEGGDVEVDMTIVEHLRDPLIHMIRNCVAHGIEPADVRRAAGKPPVGRLHLRSFQDSGSIVIELSDDGGGIDRKRIAERAQQRGLAGDGQSLSESELLDLIFHPGFSTAETVTDLSGRGVGLDVVRRNIEGIHGSVTVQSAPGEGTTFILRLPLTLAIIHGLLVAVGDESFVIPIDCVIEATRCPSVIDPKADTGVVEYRGETIPFLRLRHRLSSSRGQVVREDVVIVRHGRGQAGLIVDRLRGECQAVVKPLPSAIRGIAGLSGSTILANGAIAFIVDVFSLLQAEPGRGRTHSRTATLSNQESSCSAN